MVCGQMQRPFRTFIGVDLGGGKGKTTAVARLRLVKAAAGAGVPGVGVMVDDYGCGSPWYDDRLLHYLLDQAADDTVVAIDAPLTLTACVRCTLPRCPGAGECQVETVRWFRERHRLTPPASGGKPRYTPYTQRATEVLLHEEHGILARETLGQGMGPLTARGAYLRRALQGRYTLNHNLLEVYPKATLAQLFPPLSPAAASLPGNAANAAGVQVHYRDANGQDRSLYDSPPRNQSHVARHYKRSGHARTVREQILSSLKELSFGPGQWQEFALQNDHQLDAVLCAYTAFLWARDGWTMPDDAVFREDGWIWLPPQHSRPGT